MRKCETEFNSVGKIGRLTTQYEQTQYVHTCNISSLSFSKSCILRKKKRRSLRASQSVKTRSPTVMNATFLVLLTTLLTHVCAGQYLLQSVNALFLNHTASTLDNQHLAKLYPVISLLCLVMTCLFVSWLNRIILSKVANRIPTVKYIKS